MHRFHHTLHHRYKTSLALPFFLRGVFEALIMFAVSIVVTTGAATFASHEASNSVTDLILSNTPAFKVDDFFVYGAFMFIVYIVLVSLVHPRRIPFTLYSLGLFYLVRAGFISLTHIALFPTHSVSDFGYTFTQFFFGGSDLFFSGHTGAPFLFALLYWRERYLRYIFLACSVFFAIIVLLGHLHYSIDVASAYFITYSIYHLALYLFPLSRQWFVADDPFERRAI